MEVWKMFFLFEGVNLFRFYFSLRVCNHPMQIRMDPTELGTQLVYFPPPKTNDESPDLAS